MNATAQIIPFRSGPAEPSARYAQVPLSAAKLKLGKVSLWVLIALRSHVNRKRGDMDVWPSAAEIARECDLFTPQGKPDRRRVWRALAELERVGEITKREKRASDRGDNRSNRYTMASLPSASPVTTPSDKDVTTMTEQRSLNKGREPQGSLRSPRARDALQGDLFSRRVEEEDSIDEAKKELPSPLTQQDKQELAELAEFFEIYGPEGKEAVPTSAASPAGLKKSGSARADDRFEEFWEIYPKRVDKGGARLAWARALKKADAQRIIDGAEDYATTRDFRGYDGEDEQEIRRFTVSPTRWLDGERWEDELGLVQTAAQYRDEQQWQAEHPEEYAAERAKAVADYNGWKLNHPAKTMRDAQVPQGGRRGASSVLGPTISFAVREDEARRQSLRSTIGFALREGTTNRLATSSRKCSGNATATRRSSSITSHEPAGARRRTKLIRGLRSTTGTQWPAAASRANRDGQRRRMTTLNADRATELTRLTRLSFGDDLSFGDGVVTDELEPIVTRHW